MTEPGEIKAQKNRFQNIDRLRDMALVNEGGLERYRCFGSDPQCHVKLAGPVRPGWYVLSCTLSIEDGKSINPKFYFDTGNGYNEEETLVLPGGSEPVSKIIYLPKTVFHIRFDPTENRVLSFSLTNFSLGRIPLYALFRLVYKLDRQLHPGGSKMRRALKAAYYTITNKVRKIELLIEQADEKNDVGRYQAWIMRYDSYTRQQFADMGEMQAGFAYRPKISILVPVYNTPLQWLNECIQSVLTQVYDNWELCIADDNSTNEEVKTTLREFAAQDSRIKLHFREVNGHISATSNSALSLATGEFVALLDHDDTLSPLALYRVVEALNGDPSIDFLYSDEDKINSKGERSLPFFKPGWSPALFYSQNYITHFACARRTILESVNGFTEGKEGSQDYDLFLKVIGAGASIKHLPYILYHWRLHESSTSMVSDAKPYAHDAGKAALEKFLVKKYPKQFRSVDDGDYTFTYLPRFKFGPENKVSIIIPTKDKIDYLQPCIESIVSKSTWANYEILVLNNNSVEQQSLDYFNEVVRKYPQVRVIDAPFEFNWSRLNNFGASHATGNFLLFLNNDIVVITSDWIERLGEYASLPDIAVAGPSLLYEDGTIQHAGVVVGLNGWADHVFKGARPANFASPYVSNVLPRNSLAVTGACFLIERSKFEALGRFDESFIICGSDVEFCIRSYKKGLFNVVHGAVNLYHFESKSRGQFVPENDFVQSSIKYEPYRTRETDPFFNPNLSLNSTTPVCKT